MTSPRICSLDELHNLSRATGHLRAQSDVAVATAALAALDFLSARHQAAEDRLRSARQLRSMLDELIPLSFAEYIARLRWMRAAEPGASLPHDPDELERLGPDAL